MSGIARVSIVGVCIVVLMGMLAGSAVAQMEWEKSAGNHQKKMKVFLLSGQSNMVGYGNSLELPDELRKGNDRVLMFEDGKWQPLRPFKKTNKNQQEKLGMTEYSFGPEISFGAEIAKAWPDETIGIIKLAVGGTGILAFVPDWDKEQADRSNDGYKGPLYKKMMEKFRQAREARDFEIMGFLWKQGAKDMKSVDLGKEYLQNLKKLIEGLRRDTESPDLPFLIGSPRSGDIPDDISDIDPESVRPRAGRPGAVLVVKAQFDAQKEIPHTKTVFFRDLEKHPDDAHFNTKGQIGLGRLFAEAYLEMVKE